MDVCNIDSNSHTDRTDRQMRGTEDPAMGGGPASCIITIIIIIK